LLSTVVLTAACVFLIKGELTVFNLVALLLVAGVASNYTLFFSTLSKDPEERQRASLSVMLAATSTFIGFAMLATSSTPVLAMIGLTVAIGAVLGVLTSMVFSPS
jgi:predicted exporter